MSGDTPVEPAKCLRCELVARRFAGDPDQTEVQCGPVTHELARRVDHDRLAGLPGAFERLVESYPVGDRAAWAERAEGVAHSLLAMAARSREAEDDLTRRYGR